MIIKRNADQSEIYNYGNLVKQDTGSYTVKICSEPGETDLHVQTSMPWHHDRGYSSNIHKKIGLYCLEADENAGNLYICDMLLAYKNAPKSLIKECQNVMAVQSAGKYIDNGFVYSFKSEKDKRYLKRFAKCERPLIGKGCFFYSEAYTLLDPSLEERLQDHCYQDKFIHKHEYQPNDLIIFDNIRYTHRRDKSTGVKTLLRFAYE